MPHCDRDTRILNRVGLYGYRIGPNLWSYGDPILVGDVPQFGIIAGSFTDVNIVLANPYELVFKVSGLTPASRVNAAIGGTNMTVNGSVNVDGVYKVVTASATNQQLKFQENAGGFGSSGVTISDVSVRELRA